MRMAVVDIVLVVHNVTNYNPSELNPLVLVLPPPPGLPGCADGSGGPGAMHHNVI